MDALKGFLQGSFSAGPISIVVWEVLYMVALTLVLSQILNRNVFQPVLAVLDERAKRLTEAAGGHEDLLGRIDDRMREHAGRLAEARRDALARVDKAKHEADAKRQSQVAEARARADAVVGAAADRLAKAAGVAEADLEKRADDLAAAIASNVLGRKVAS